ncbi:MAG: branched-chain amino acid ABC transporter permease [Candidatus Eremiobacteraeota bacterium]|nr:branched-chain amino acid ABC transporter permease [Candidatus Eremiobacteraeota bacterium]
MLLALTLQQFSDQFINGITLGMLYILVALGLNIILGLMGVINYSHGSFFMLGAYVAYTLDPFVGFWPSILLAAVVLGVFGMAFEWVLIRPLYRRIPEYTLLLTFGTALIFEQFVRYRWGDDAVRFELPAAFSGTVTLANSQFPLYKDVMLVVITVLVLALVWLLINRTNIGMIIRAGTRDAEMVTILGINMPIMFTLVFGIGSFMAGLAGALAAPVYAIQPSLASQWVILTFVIVIVGGIGSFWGAIVGGLLIGILSSLMELVWPPAVEMTGFLIMGIILLVRPRSLFGVEGLFE